MAHEAIATHILLVGIEVVETSSLVYKTNALNRYAKCRKYGNGSRCLLRRSSAYEDFLSLLYNSLSQ